MNGFEARLDVLAERREPDSALLNLFAIVRRISQRKEEFNRADLHIDLQLVILGSHQSSLLLGQFLVGLSAS